MKVKRRQSREVAFSLIFEWGFREEESLSDIISQAEIGRQIDVDKFAYELASKTIENSARLDEVIKQYSSKWRLNRIPRVTLAVLRMSFCELSLMEDIPVGATINEAVELVKKYATEEDAAYLNGILGQYDRDRNGISGDMAEGEQAATATPEEEDGEGEPDENSNGAAVEPADSPPPSAEQAQAYPVEPPMPAEVE